MTKQGKYKAAPRRRVRDGFTPRHEKLCQLVASGKYQSHAYREAFNKPDLLPQDAAERASKILARPRCQARLAQLRGQVTFKTLLTMSERMEILAKIAQDETAPRNDRTRAIMVYNTMAPEGLPAQKMEITGKDGKPLKVEAVVDGTLQVTRLSVRERAARLRAAKAARDLENATPDPETLTQVSPSAPPVET